MNEEKRKEFIEGWNMLSRPANDPEFLEMRRIVVDAFLQFPEDIQWQFMDQPDDQCAEIKFFAEQCAIHSSMEIREKLLGMNYIMFNLNVFWIFRNLQEACVKGLLAPRKKQ